MTEEISDVLPRRFRELRPQLKAVLRRFGVDPADHGDLLQEVLLAAVERWKSIRQLEPYLVAVAGNRCRRWIRLHLREKAVVPLDLGTVEPAIEPGQQAVERRVQLQGVFALLKPRQRKALSLRRQGFTHEEVGVALGLHPNSGRKVYVGALRRIERSRRQRTKLPEA